MDDGQVTEGAEPAAGGISQTRDRSEVVAVVVVRKNVTRAGVDEQT